ncbi:HSP20 family protein [Dioscorea alata]|uniref:HSP20 family protein n=1 Tax=Dioscorea alata TaxID=55571 RepID=A0ACB7UUA9_DIOAL|nr:HSP20 family protein [Dioscorea alata]
MASCVSNISTSLSIPSLYSKRNNKLLSSKFVKCMKSSESSGKDNLDHLQRVSKQSQQQRRWVAPSSPIGLWDRFPTARTINQMLETMERIMEDPSSSIAYNNNNNNNNNNNGASALSSMVNSQPMMNQDMIYRRGRTPWEIKEQEREYKLRFDMPGMSKNDVQLFVEEKMLVIKAEKKINGEENDNEEWPARSFGKYNSRIALPESVDVEKIKAEVKDGVLYVTIPKSLSSSKVFDIPVL